MENKFGLVAVHTPVFVSKAMEITLVQCVKQQERWIIYKLSKYTLQKTVIFNKDYGVVRFDARRTMLIFMLQNRDLQRCKSLFCSIKISDN